jgi:hypothetical protein
MRTLHSTLLCSPHSLEIYCLVDRSVALSRHTAELKRYVVTGIHTANFTDSAAS